MNSKVVYNITRYSLGALFVFSGFAKAINPFGLAVQFDAYFTAMGLEVLAPLGPLGAIVLPALEMWLGFLLLIGLAERGTRWAVGGVMLFFTGLTLWIALTNPVKDCGCFGELWKISNWATFVKNIVFLAAAVLFWFQTPRTPKAGTGWGRWVVALGLAVVSVALPLWCWAHLPLIETSPWAVGRDVRAQMRSTYQEQTTSQVVYRHRVTGVEQRFALTDTTWHDETVWDYVRTDHQSRATGSQGALADVVLVEPRGELNVARAVFDTPGELVLVVLPDPRAVDQGQAERLCRVVEAARERMVFVTCLTATSGVEIPYNMPHLMADRSLLHAMMPNVVGGVMVVRDGVVCHKSAL